MKKLIYTTEVDEYALESAKECMEANEIDNITENDVWEWATEDNERWLGDERSNLDIPLDGRILVIASLGLWNGRKQGYKIIEERNVNGIFTIASFGGDIELYGERGNIYAIARHHDGTNYYTFKALKEATEYDNLLNRICNNEPIF